MTEEESLQRFLERQYEKGLELWLDQGQLRFKAPKAISSAELIPVLKKNKAQIIQMLEEKDLQAEQDQAKDGGAEGAHAVVDQVEAEYPLSMSQSAIWMLYRFAPDSPAYNTTFCAKLGAAADLEVMQKSYLNILHRHGMLRSRFLDGEFGPVQQVMTTTNASVERVDAAGWSGDAVDQWLKKEAVAPFDLSQAQPLRVKLLQTDTGNLLIATIHHVAADLWSLLLIAGDLFGDYQHYLDEGFFEVKKPKHSYQQHVEWQQQYMQSEEVERVKDFWRDYTANAVVQLDIPTDFDRPPIMQMTTARHSTILDSAVASKVRGFCKRQGATPYVLFETAFQLLLYRYVQHSDFFIGTPTFGRSKQVLESIVGDFANPVVLRAKINEQQAVLQLLKQNQQDLFKVIALQDFPFPALVELVNPPRDASRTPLFQHMFVWHQGNPSAFLQQNVIEDILPMSGPCGAPYDILLSVSDLGEGFECHWMYQISLYDETSAKQFAEEYQQLILAMLDIDAESSVEQLLAGIGLSSQEPRVTPADQVIFQKRQLSKIVDVQSSDSKAVHAFSLVKDRVKQQPISSLHEKGWLQTQGEGVATLLPLQGSYNAKGQITLTDIQWGWGIVDRKLVDLQQRVSAVLPSSSMPVFVARCFVSDRGQVKNVLYLETSDDELIHQLTQACPEFHDVINLPRFIYDDNGHVDKAWLLGIPVYDQRALSKKITPKGAVATDNPIAIVRENESLLPTQCYPVEVKGRGNSGQKSADSLLPAATTIPALLTGTTLQSEIPVNNIVEGLVRTATLNPTAALQFVDEVGGAKALTYAELLQAAVLLAQGLLKQGVIPEQVVVLQVADREQYFTLWWALLWIGAMPLTIAVPVRYEDEQPIARKLKSVIANLPSCVLVTDADDASNVALKDYVTSDVLNLVDINATAATQVDEATEAVENQAYHRDNAVAFLQLTSGSTGTPKIIQIGHQGILHQVHAAAEYNQFQAGDKTLNWLPFDHVVPMLTTHLRDVMLGLDQYQVLTHRILAAPLEWLTLMEKYQINHSWAPNFGFKLVVDALQKLQAIDIKQSISSLTHIKTLMNAGEQVIPSVIADFVRLLQPFGLKPTAMQAAFGMAESCTCITYHNQFVLTDEKTSTFVSLGGVVPGVEVRIADENNQVLNEGQIGRMQIRGPVVTPGYLNNAAANEESFVGDGWFNSGDLGFITDAQLVLTGREKEMIIIRGVNYYCYEIEESITRYSNVVPTFVAAFSVENDQSGEDLVVCYVAKDSASSDSSANSGAIFENDVKHINEIINADFSIEARYIIAIGEAEFHKTTSGKIQRSQFRQLFEKGQYQAQCAEFDKLSSVNRTVPYHLYQAGWQAVCYPTSTNEKQKDKQRDKQKAKQSNSAVYCFDASLAKRIDKACSKHQVVMASDVADICLPSEPISNTVLVFSLPSILDVQSTTALAQNIGQTLVQLSDKFSQHSADSDDSVDGANSPDADNRDDVVHVVLANQLNSALPSSLWVTPLIDALSAEITSAQTPEAAGTYALRLRITDENNLSDEVLDTLHHLRTVEAPLLLDGETVHRSALEPVAIAIDTPRKLSKKVYAVTGGFGGLGLQVVKKLLSKENKIIVIGRRVLTECEKTQATLNQLHGLYGKDALSYQAVTALDEALIETAIQTGLSALQLDSLEGVFHLAGSYLQQPVASMTDEYWSQLLEAKYQGSIALGNYLQNHWPKAALIFFSSVNSVFGGAGIAGYGVASALQNQLADYFNQQGSIKSFCLNWSLWPEIGMAAAFTPQDIAFAENKGFLPMSAERDLLWLDSVLTAEPGCYWFGLNHQKSEVVSEINWQQTAQRWLVRASYYLDQDDEGRVDETKQQQLNALSPSVITQWLQDNQYTGIARVPAPIIDVVALSQALPTNSQGGILFSQLSNMPSSQQEQGDGPRNETDQLLMDVWQSLLGNRVTHIDQTFFECGGNSVVVTQLAYKLTLHLQRQLPLASIFEHSTIRSYSDFLKASEAEGNDDESSEFSKVLSSLSIAAQSKKLSQHQLTLLSANKKPLENTIIYVPALIGLPHNYQHLLKKFAQCKQVLLSQAVLAQPSGSIRQIATDYIALLESNDIDIQRSVLVGWSFGGCVAFEMARQLRQREKSEQEPKLIIIDSGIHDAIPAFLVQDTVATPLFAKDLGLTGVMLPEVERLLPKLTAQGLEVDADALEKWHNAYKNNIQQLREYTPEIHSSPNKTIYIRANGNTLGTKDMGWGDQFSNFQVFESPADHQQVIYDNLLPEQIRGCLGGVL